jgi:dCMP deaminase
MSRITRPELYMGAAQLFSHRSTCRRGQVGAVIVVEGRIVSSGYNGAPPGMPHCLDVGCDTPPSLIPGKSAEVGCQRAIHAEANAIAWAARYGVRTEHGSMFCTHAMCRACAQLCVAAGIQAVTYKEPYRDDGLEFLEEAGLVVLQHGSDS